MPDPLTLALATLAFALAGVVKGVVGMGLPIVAMGLLGLAMPPAQAAALLVVPSLVTNVWQMAAGPALGPLVRRLATLLLGVCVGVAFGIGFITTSGMGSPWPGLALGAVLMLYAGLGLWLRPLRLAPRHEGAVAPVVGVITGVVTGATGVFSVPAVPYLSAIGLGKDELIQALGLSFTVSTLALAVGLGASSVFTPALGALSFAALLPALGGMVLGQRLRARLDAQRFRVWFFRSMLAVGAAMVLKAALATSA
jgi:uncharacterized protein